MARDGAIDSHRQLTSSAQGIALILFFGDQARVFGSSLLITLIHGLAITTRLLTVQHISVY